MSYSNSFPTQTPVLNLNFATGSDQFLDSRISFSRADTPPTYAAPSAVHYWSNEKHLSTENLLLQSQDFDTTWANDGSVGIGSITGGQMSPDGTSTAWLLTANTFTGGSARIQQSIPVNTNTEYTMVAHVKAGTASHAFISFRASSTHSCSVTLDFATQALTNTAFIFTDVSSSVTALDNDWFKLTLTGTTGVFNNSSYARVGLSDGSAVSSNGNPSWNASGETMYAWGIQLSSTNSKVYDSPTTTQISREYSSTLKSVTNAGDPRFEYDPASDGQSVGTALGLLVEASATNLQRYGSAFASWSGQNRVTTTANVAIAPNGLLEADLIAANSSATQSHNVSDNPSVIVSGTVYTGSVYVKDFGQRYVQLIGGSSSFGSSQWATYDLQTGSVDANGVTASSQNVGNGWWRIQVTMTSTAAGAGVMVIGLANSATATRLPLFAGNDYDGVLCWGFQLETGSAASSLVDTGTGSSQLSRAADSCSVDLSQINYSGGEVTLVADTNTSAIDDYRQAASLIDDSQNQVTLYGNSYNNRLVAILGGGESSTLSQTSANGISALSFGVNDIAATRNGASPVTDTSQAFPNVSAGNLKIGGSGSSQMLNGTIKRVALYNVALSDTELQAITS